MRKKINLTDSIMDVLVLMGEGNPGALTVLAELTRGDPCGFMDILGLDDMNIRGSQIWVGFKDFADQDMKVFREAIKNRDPKMVKKINEVCSYSGKVAVTSGASFEK